MKLGKLLLSALLPLSLLSGCSGTDTEEQVEQEEAKVEADRELAFKIGLSSEETEAFYLENKLSDAIEKLFLTKEGDVGETNVLTSPLEAGKVMQWNIEVIEGKMYSLVAETETESYTFTDIDLTDVDNEKDLVITKSGDGAALEFTSKTDGAMKIEAEKKSAAETDEAMEEQNLINEEEYVVAPAQEDEGVYEYVPEAPVYEDNYYDNSYTDPGYVTPDYGYTAPETGYDTPALPGQNQDACLGEDALIQY